MNADEVVEEARRLIPELLEKSLGNVQDTRRRELIAHSANLATIVTFIENERARAHHVGGTRTEQRDAQREVDALRVELEDKKDQIRWMQVELGAALTILLSDVHAADREEYRARFEQARLRLNREVS